MRFLMPYIKRQKWYVIATLVLKAAASGVDVFIPWALSRIIDDCLPVGDEAGVWTLGLFTVLASLIGLLGNVLGNRFAAHAAVYAVSDVRESLYRHISLLSCEGIDTFTVPSLISRVTSDTYVILQGIRTTVSMGVRAPLLLVGCLIVTVILDPVLSLAILVLSPLMFYYSFKVTTRGTKLYRGLQDVSDRMIRVLRENVTGSRVIRALSKTEYEKKRFEKVNEEVNETDRKAALNMAKLNPVISLLLNVGYVLVIAIGALRIYHARGSVGSVIAFMTYFVLLLNSIRMITRIFTVLSKANASVNRVREVIEYEDTLSFPSSSPEKEKIEGAPAVEFKDVTFSYPGGSFLLGPVSFKLEKGRTLGVIGTTGSGKSTVLSLMLRFYDVKSGQILLDGIDVRELTAEQIRTRFGAVFQNDTLFRDSVSENLLIGRSISSESLNAAIRDAEAAEFIEDAGGLEAEVAIKGANFSGGQRQRLLIARALAGDPDVLLLDDSSSALDYRTDAAVRSNLAQNRPGRTAVIVAQRCSSVLHADAVLFLDRGKVLGLGTHEELLASCPLYRDIYESQMGDFAEAGR